MQKALGSERHVNQMGPGAMTWGLDRVLILAKKVVVYDAFARV